MPDTIRTLGDLQAIYADQVAGDISAQDLRDFLVSALGPWNAGAIAGAATLTAADLNRIHVCSGTTADYTVALPTAVGVAGQWIGFRMAQGLTRLVTLDGAGAETIDSQASRVMWAGEAAILASDGANWFKFAGKPRPMRCILRRNSTQGGVTSGPLVKILLDGVEDDTTSMADLANNQIVIRRPGAYFILGAVIYSALTANSPTTNSVVYINTNVDFSAEVYGAAGGQPSPPAIAPARPLVAGDTAHLRAYQTSGATQSVYGVASGETTRLTVQEVPSW